MTRLSIPTLNTFLRNLNNLWNFWKLPEVQQNLNDPRTQQHERSPGMRGAQICRGGQTSQETSPSEAFGRPCRKRLVKTEWLDRYYPGLLPQNCIIWQKCCFSSPRISLYIWDHKSKTKAQIKNLKTCGSPQWPTLSNRMSYSCVCNFSFEKSGVQWRVSLSLSCFI